jgi:hypothetical protein
VVGVLLATGRSKKGNIMDAYQIAQLIVSVFGFGILSWIILGMRQRLKNQSKMIEDMSNWFEVVKNYSEFINAKKLIEDAKDIVALREEKIIAENEKIIREIKEDMKKDYEMSMKTADKLKYELVASSELAVALLSYVPPTFRNMALEESPECAIKNSLSQNAEKMPYYGNSLLAVMGSKIGLKSETISLKARSQAIKQMLEKEEHQDE